jgi:hypothetical protein
MIMLPVGVTILVYGALATGLAVRAGLRWAHRMWVPSPSRS